MLTKIGRPAQAEGAAGAKAPICANSSWAGPGSPGTAAALASAEPLGSGGRVGLGAMPGLGKELGAGREPWNPEEGVLISALRGAFPVRGLERLGQEVRGEPVGQVGSGPGHPGWVTLMTPIKVSLPPLGQISGPLTQGSALPVFHPSPPRGPLSPGSWMVIRAPGPMKG